MKLIFYGKLLFEVLLPKTKVVYCMHSPKAAAVVTMWCHTVESLSCGTKCVFQHQGLDISFCYFFEV